MTEMIKAFFDSRTDATKAIEDLVEAGIRRSAITLLPESETADAPGEVGSFDGTAPAENGFWASLRKLFTSEDDGVYADSAGRRGTLVHIEAEASEVDLVQTILDEHDAVDVSEQAEAWNRTGGADAVPVDGSQSTPFADSPTSSVPVTGATSATTPLVPDERAVASFGEPSSTTAARDIVERMDVIAADGTKVGTVDHLEGRDQIKLARNTSPDGRHHYVPLAWVDHVDAHVHLTKAAPEIRASW